MDRHSYRSAPLLKRPSAFLPLAMSLTALTLVLVSLATGGITHDADEGTVAHLWQLLMVGQLPVIAFFVIRWLPRAPKPALRILAWHVAAAIASMAPVYILNL